jgi:hypothetical protein
MKEITLQITIDEANLILEALGSLPFIKVYALIGKIQGQAGQQIGAGSPAAQADDAAYPAPTVSE